MIRGNNNAIRQYIRRIVQEALLEATDPKVKNTKINAAKTKLAALKAEEEATKKELSAAQTMAETIKLSSLIEADEEEAPKEEEENPFEKAAEEEPSGEEEGGEEKGEEKEKEGDKEPKSSEEKEDKGLSVNFNVNSVKKYNDALFRNNTGTVKKITKDGLTVQVEPDGVDVFVNFNDITEAANKFFKKGK